MEIRRLSADFKVSAAAFKFPALPKKIAKKLKVSIYRARQNCILTKSKGWKKIGKNQKLDKIENRQN